MSNPSKPNRLKDIADAYGEPIEDLLPRVVSEEGSISGAARKLGVASNAIRYWLKKMNYAATTRRIVELEKVNP